MLPAAFWTSLELSSEQAVSIASCAARRAVGPATLVRGRAQSTAALPVGTIIVILLIWGIITVPLTVFGGIAGKNHHVSPPRNPIQSNPITAPKCVLAPAPCAIDCRISAAYGRASRLRVYTLALGKALRMKKKSSRISRGQLPRRMAAGRVCGPGAHQQVPAGDPGAALVPLGGAADGHGRRASHHNPSTHSCLVKGYLRQSVWIGISTLSEAREAGASLRAREQLLWLCISSRLLPPLELQFSWVLPGLLPEEWSFNVDFSSGCPQVSSRSAPSTSSCTTSLPASGATRCSDGIGSAVRKWDGVWCLDCCPESRGCTVRAENSVCTCISG